MAHFKPPYPQFQRGKLIGERLVGLWPFYEGSGNRVHDISGSGLHGTIDSNINPSTAWVGSRNGWALAGFTAGYDIDLDRAVDVITDDYWTCCVLLDFDKQATNKYYSLLGDSGGFQETLLSLRDTTTLNYIVEWSGSNVSRVTTPNDSYHHWAIVRDGNTVYFYKDAVQLGSDDVTGETTTWSKIDVIGGNNGTTASISVSDLRLYDRSLTAKEIAQIFAGLG